MSGFRRLCSVVIGLVVIGFIVCALAGIGVGLALRASLPRLDGECQVPGLEQRVTVARDHQGVPTISGSSRADVAAALGFVHAQDRFFQMDLQRRRASGEMAELFGPRAVSWDARVRAHRLGEVAQAALRDLQDEDRRILEAYAAGVNSGLRALDERPFEYLVLRKSPRPWAPRDTVLCVLSMFLQLNPWGGERELALSTMAEILPAGVFDLLACPGSEWDAALDGSFFDLPPIPGPEVLDLRRSDGSVPTLPEAGEPSFAGSNSWAVAGSNTIDGRALLACDMHLGLMVPNIWFRARLEWPESRWDGAQLKITGVTLPGTPFVVAGSNGRVAWGFTNSYGDWVDVLRLEMNDAGAFTSSGEPVKVLDRTERIVVAGEKDREIELRQSEAGPVIGHDARGRLLVVRWTAHDPEAVRPAFRGLETARNVDQALEAGARLGIPPQNLMVADRDGHVGWTVAGRIPKRVNCSGDGLLRQCDWSGWLLPADYPVVKDPADGLVWTANARALGGAAYELIGDGGYALGARAQQIRDGLRSLDGANERDMLAIQLDDRAVFLGWWRDLLLEVLDDQRTVATAERDLLRDVVAGWSGRAAVDDAGYRMVRAFRISARGLVLDPLVAACADVPGPCGWQHLGQRESALRRLITQRPPHLLDAKYATWHDLLLVAADRVVNEFSQGGARLEEQTWGRRNTVRLRHPLSSALPDLAARFLDMPPSQLPGDSHMPRVQSLTFGASERFVVSPGREEDGYFHMPGGQSGHPLSPFYAAGHEDWVSGTPSPFLPGERAHVLVLTAGHGP